jgi:hypothetical protein
MSTTVLDHLQWESHHVLTVMWVVPSPPSVVMRAYHFQFDISFRAMRPYECTIPSAMIRNKSFPAGFTIWPIGKIESFL